MTEGRSTPGQEESAGEVGRMGLGSGISVVGALFQQGSLVILTFAIARLAGDDELGRWAIAFAVLQIGLLVCQAGMRNALTRWIALHLADGRPGAARGDIVLGVSIAAGLTVAVAFVGLIVAPWTAESLFDRPELVTPLRVAVLTLIPAVHLQTVLAATQGFRSMRDWALIGNILEPGLRLAIAVAALLAGGGATSVLVAGLISQSVAAVIGTLRLRRRVPRESASYVDRYPFLRFAAASWVSSASAQAIRWVDVLILASVASVSDDDIAVYQVASRLLTVAVAVLPPITTALGPRITHLWKRDDHEGVQRLYKVAASWMVRITLPAFVVLVVLPDSLLRIFGDDFTAGRTVTLILVIGWVTNALTGPCAIALSFLGRNGWNMFDNLAGLILNVGLNVWLIPDLGIEGAAWAWTASLVLVNVARVVQARLLTVKAFPVSVELWRAAVSATVAGVAGWGVVSVVDYPIDIVAGGGTIYVVYLALSVRFGLPSADREVGAMLLSKLQRQG